jgi:hypothetical protein
VDKTKVGIGKGMKLEIEGAAKGLPLGMAAAGANVAEQALPLPAWDKLAVSWLACPWLKLQATPPAVCCSLTLLLSATPPLPLRLWRDKPQLPPAKLPQEKRGLVK